MSESKYLGEYFDDRGDNKTRIQKKMIKVAHTIAVAKTCGSESKMGKEAMKSREGGGVLSIFDQRGCVAFQSIVFAYPS